jgi:antitoxin (DNA-binding transcriptional repressor) of toxin-antitoxin stability system
VYDADMAKISIADACERLDELVERTAATGERVTVVEGGCAVAVMVSPGELAELDAAQAIVDYLRREPNTLMRSRE